MRCAPRGGGKLVNVSSPSVAHLGRAIEGLDATPADPVRARGNYSRTKAAAELLAMGADGEDGLLVTIVRPHIVWGPGDTQLVGRIVDRARSGRLPLLDEGMALIDTTYVTNAAEAIVAAYDRIEDVHGESFVVSNGEPRTVRDVFNGWCDAAGRAPAQHPDPRLRGPLRRPRRGTDLGEPARARRAVHDGVPGRADVDRALVRSATHP